MQIINVLMYYIFKVIHAHLNFHSKWLSSAEHLTCFHPGLGTLGAWQAAARRCGVWKATPFTLLASRWKASHAQPAGYAVASTTRAHGAVSRSLGCRAVAPSLGH